MHENWIIPCNIKRFDVIEHFKNSDTVIWKNSFTICLGDTVYLYIGSPYGEIKYKCVVINENISENDLQKNSYAIPNKKNNNYFSKKEKYIQMELVCGFPEKTFPLKDLQEHGLGQVQIQARTNRMLQQYINEIESILNINTTGGNE